MFFGFGTLNIYTQIGLVTLVGLIAKHGILIVEFANAQQRSTGAARGMRWLPPAREYAPF